MFLEKPREYRPRNRSLDAGSCCGEAWRGGASYLISSLCGVRGNDSGGVRREEGRGREVEGEGGRVKNRRDNDDGGTRDRRGEHGETQCSKMR